MKDFLINLYLLPTKLSYRLAFSIRNRIMLYVDHLAGCSIVINKHLKGRKGIILDIGCHNGGSCYFLAKQIPNIDIIGFEPIPEVFELASKQYKNISNISFENMAISDADGESYFFQADNEVSSSLYVINEAQNRFHVDKKILVKTSKLDTYLDQKKVNYEQITAIKIDVQGHELSVLQGAVQSLKKTKFIMLEFSNHDDYKGGCKYYEVDSFLRTHGFKLQNIFTPFSKDCLYEYDAIYVNVNI
jgi:FkbM family methyltransferase